MNQLIRGFALASALTMAATGVFAQDKITLKLADQFPLTHVASKIGPQAFKTHFQTARPAFDGPLPEPPTSHIAGLRTRPHFSLKRIQETEEAFFADYLPRALYTTIPARREGGQGEVSALSPAHFAAAAEDVPALRPG